MTDKQLRKLKRAELIELVYYLRKENERLETLLGGKERTLSQADINAVAQGVADILSGKEPPACDAPSEEQPPEPEEAAADSEAAEPDENEEQEPEQAETQEPDEDGTDSPDGGSDE